jgi:hypothetical protein
LKGTESSAEENVREPVDAALTTPVSIDVPSPAPVAVAASAVEEPQFAETSPPALEPAAEVSVLEQPPPEPPIRLGATPESVLASLKADWPAELVQVETDPGKVQAIPESEDLLGTRAGRTRPELAPLSEEPLIQVETRKRESPPDDNRRTPETAPV